jgi:hypothetical protein
VLPMLGGKIVEGQQSLTILGQAFVSANLTAFFSEAAA